ncbi:MAG TPA: hypothetical protein VIK71_02210 [Flavobacteriales bacterium]
MLTKEFIERYFLTEKQDGLMFLISAVIAIGLATFLFIKGTEGFGKGLSIVLVATSIWQLLIGYPALMHSDSHRVDMVYAYDMNPQLLKTAESQRLENRLKTLKYMRAIEATLFVAGVLLVVFNFPNPEAQLWFGIGLGLVFQMLVLFIMDHNAAKRAEQYWFYIRTMH